MLLKRSWLLLALVSFFCLSSAGLGMPGGLRMLDSEEPRDVTAWLRAKEVLREMSGPLASRIAPNDKGVSDQLVDSMNCKLVAAGKQVVAGVNWFLKAQLTINDKTSYALLRVNEQLPAYGSGKALSAVMFPVTKERELQYFQDSNVIKLTPH